MTYYAGFGHFAIRNHNEEVLREVRKLHLEKRLRDNRKPRSGHPYASIFKRLMPLPRWAGPAA
jgi:hypothetical protein